MKKLLMIAALFLAVPAQAQVSEEVCISLGDYGAKIVEARQLGMPKQRVIKLIKTDDASLYSLMVTIIDLAYALPEGTSPQVLDDIVTNKCLESLHNARYPANT